MAYVFHPLGCNGEIEPQVIEEIQVEVLLPFENGSLNNFMASSATHRYLDEEWSRKLALFVCTEVTMVEKEDDMKLAANNQLMEGMINNEKNIITTIKSYLSEPTLYFWYFYNNLTTARNHLVSELENTEGWLQTQKCKAEKKRQRRNGRRRKRR